MSTKLRVIHTQRTVYHDINDDGITIEIIHYLTSVVDGTDIFGTMFLIWSKSVEAKRSQSTFLETLNDAKNLHNGI